MNFGPRSDGMLTKQVLDCYAVTGLLSAQQTHTRSGDREGREIMARAAALRAVSMARRSDPPLALVRKPTPAERRIEAATDDAARRFAECRTLGHSWKHVGPAQVTARPPIGFYNGAGFVSVCTHCGTERTKWVGRYGSVGPPRYRYPDGYQRRGDDGLSREQWRRTWFVSVFDD